MNQEQILYEDKDIIVCYKPAQIATQTAKVGQPDMVSEVTNYLASSGKMQGRPYVGIVHRLDQPVEGILVFGKNPNAAEKLSRQIIENRMEKHYYAVVRNKRRLGEADAEKKGTLVNYLYKDGKTNMSFVVPKEQKGAKRAELFYEIKKRMPVKEFCEKGAEFPAALAETIENTEEELELIGIKLITGRHHQIRVQLSHAGKSLLGDYKYADEQTKSLSRNLQQKQAALCAYKLGFFHPATGKRLYFEKMPQGQIFQKFLS